MIKNRRIHSYYHRRQHNDHFNQRIRRRTGASTRSDSFAQNVDLIFNTNIPPTVINGVYTLSGS